MRQDSCRHCGHDVEGAGRNWRDRGGDTQCPAFCGYDQDGVSIFKRRRKHMAQPFYTMPIRPTRWRYLNQWGRTEILTQPR